MKGKVDVRANLSRSGGAIKQIKGCLQVSKSAVQHRLPTSCAILCQL